MKLLSATAAALLLAVSAAQGQQPAVESNVTFTLRVTCNLDEGTATARKTTTVALKNQDILRIAQAEHDVEFSKKARLMQRLTFTAEGEVQARTYFIRDPAHPDTTFPLDLERNEPRAYIHAEKYKLKTETGAGSGTLIARSVVDIELDPLGGPQAAFNIFPENFTFSGYDLIRYKRVATEGSTVDLENSTTQLTGDTNFTAIIKRQETYVTGVAEGKMRVSGSKIIPVQAQ